MSNHLSQSASNLVRHIDLPPLPSSSSASPSTTDPATAVNTSVNSINNNLWSADTACSASIAAPVTPILSSQTNNNNPTNNSNGNSDNNNPAQAGSILSIHNSIDHYLNATTNSAFYKLQTAVSGTSEHQSQSLLNNPITELYSPFAAFDHLIKHSESTNIVGTELSSTTISTPFIQNEHLDLPNKNCCQILSNNKCDANNFKNHSKNQEINLKNNFISTIGSKQLHNLQRIENISSKMKRQQQIPQQSQQSDHPIINCDGSLISSENSTNTHRKNRLNKSINVSDVYVSLIFYILRISFRKSNSGRIL